MSLQGKTILITGAARRLGKVMAHALADAGANIVIHYGQSENEAEGTAQEIRALGVQAWTLQHDLTNLSTLAEMLAAAWKLSPIDALVNSASIFEPLQWDTTTLEDWQRHMDINLTAPFLLTQAFAKLVNQTQREGRIVNILDWRALRPGVDHFPYTIAKAGLAAMTQAYARALAPKITVNGLALGAILPPSGSQEKSDTLIKSVPMQRWASLDEVGQSLIFLLDGPTFITGEIIHLDGGRHIV